MDIVKIIIDAARAAVGVPAAAYALSAMGLNLQFGYTGLLNFGHVASMLVGAYGMAITVDQNDIAHGARRLDRRRHAGGARTHNADVATALDHIRTRGPRYNFRFRIERAVERHLHVLYRSATKRRQ